MMKLRRNIRLYLLLVFLSQLIACNQLGIKKPAEEKSDQDLFEIQNRAETAYLNDDLVNSEKDYLVLIEELPEVAMHWFRLANIYVRTNRPVAAINLYREAVLRDPTYSKAWFNLSIVQLKQTAYSLNEMLIYVDKSDPMYDRAKKLLEGIQAVVNQE